MDHVRHARKADVPLLPAIERAADKAFEEIGITGLSGGATVKELENASYIALVNS